MQTALDKANELKKPVILDPVGAGASKIRTKTAISLLEKGITIVKGNFDEINALVNDCLSTRGVDSINYDLDSAPQLAIDAARRFNTIAALTGPVDFVSDGQTTYSLENGHRMLSYVTGTGCAAAAISAAFAAVADPLQAVVSAITTFNIAAEQAAENAGAPGSFNVNLIDSLYKTDRNIIAEKMKVKQYGS
jgi:hydroxyethylthiazole kinase